MQPPDVSPGAAWFRRPRVQKQSQEEVRPPAVLSWEKLEAPLTVHHPGRLRPSANHHQEQGRGIPEMTSMKRWHQAYVGTDTQRPVYSVTCDAMVLHGGGHRICEDKACVSAARQAMARRWLVTRKPARHWALNEADKVLGKKRHLIRGTSLGVIQHLRRYRWHRNNANPELP